MNTRAQAQPLEAAVASALAEYSCVVQISSLSLCRLFSQHDTGMRPVSQGSQDARDNGL